MTGDQAAFGFGGAEAKKRILPKIPKISPVPIPDPLPTPVMSDEIQSATSKVRKRKIGRRRNILAGRMMAGRRNILNTFNTKLGES